MYRAGVPLKSTSPSLICSISRSTSLSTFAIVVDGLIFQKKRSVNGRMRKGYDGDSAIPVSAVRYIQRVVRQTHSERMRDVQEGRADMDLSHLAKFVEQAQIVVDVQVAADISRKVSQLSTQSESFE